MSPNVKRPLPFEHRGEAWEGAQANGRTVCSDLRCPNTVGPDGCFHQPEEPWCAEHLRGCSECRTEIDLSHEPFHVQAARHFAGSAA